MNGRCKNDPLDTADDVCGICGDEFCSACLIAARIGKKKLVCKNCAVEHSGLRAGQKSKVASKHQVRKQKRTLKSSAPQGGNNTFTFFDDPDSTFEYDLENARESPGTQISSAGASESGKSKKKKKKRRGKSEPVKAKTKTTTPPKDESKNRRVKMAGRRKNNLVQTAMAGPAAAAPEQAQNIPAPTSKDVATEPQAPVSQVDTVATDPPPPAASEATAPAATTGPKPVNTPVTAASAEPSSPSAADLLSVLKADEAAAASIPMVEGAVGNLNLESSPFSDPFANPVADPASPASVLAEPATGKPLAGELPLNAVQELASSGAEAGQHKRRSPGDGTVSGQGRQSRSNISDPFAAGSASPFPSDSPTSTPLPEIVPQAIEYEPVAFEPELTESFEPASFESETPEPVSYEPQTFDTETFDTETFEPLTPEPAVFTSSLPLPAPLETETPEPADFVPDSFETGSFETHLSQTATPEPVLVSAVAETESQDASASGAEPSETVKADTDSNGDWIPPLLRGMAPVTEREGLPLPQRRQED